MLSKHIDKPQAHKRISKHRFLKQQNNALTEKQNNK
jgi:hypothetical protein